MAKAQDVVGTAGYGLLAMMLGLPTSINWSDTSSLIRALSGFLGPGGGIGYSPPGQSPYTGRIPIGGFDPSQSYNTGRIPIGGGSSGSQGSGIFSLPSTLGLAQQGGFVADVPGIISRLGNVTGDRLLGGHGQPSWDQSWNNWFATPDYYGPGQMSPAEATFRRIGQHYGGFGENGQPIGVLDSPIVQALAGVRAAQDKSPALDPTYGMNLLASRFAGSGAPKPQDWLAQQAQIEENAGPSGATFIGQTAIPAARQLYESGPQASQAGTQGVSRLQDLISGTRNPVFFAREGLKDTRGMRNDITGVLSDIDREQQLSLAPQLQEIQASLSGAGMGQSGAGQLALAQASNASTAEAMRRKRELMAQLTESQLGREATATNLLTQTGAQQQQQERDLLAQASGQATGMTGQQYEAEQARQGELARMMAGAGADFAESRRSRLSNILSQALQAQTGVEESERQREAQALEGGLGRRAGFIEQGGNIALQGLLGSDAALLTRQQAESGAQSNALRDYMTMFGQREDLFGSRLRQAVSLVDMQRSMQNEQLAQALQFRMLPLNVLMQIATGVSSGPVQAGRQNPILAGLGSGLGQGIGQLIVGAGQQGGQAANDWWQRINQ